MKQYIWFVIFCCFSKKYVGLKIDVDAMGINDFNTGKRYSPTLYHDVNSILKVLEDPQHLQEKGVKELLNIYYEARNNKIDIKSIKKHPFIAIEGLAGSGKTTLVKALSEKINASTIHTQSSKIKRLKNLSKNTPVVHAACLQLSHYISVLEFDQILRDSPIVLDRFWFSNAAAFIGRKFFSGPKNNILPPKGDTVYNWPKDLLKPDLIIFLKCDEDERLRRLTKRSKTDTIPQKENKILLKNYRGYRKNVILAYEYLGNPTVTYFLNGNLPQKEVLEEAYFKVKPLLK